MIAEERKDYDSEPSFIARVDGHYQIFEMTPDMAYWGGWGAYLVRANGFSPDEPMWFAVPANNPGVANWYNRERLPWTPPPEALRILSKERALALAMVWMRGGREFKKFFGS